jgi:hypothetical protein
MSRRPTLTEPMRQVLAALAKNQLPMTATEVGAAVWPTLPHRRRLAGTVLRGCERRGLVERQRLNADLEVQDQPVFIWRATLLGRHAIHAPATETA